MKSPTPTQILTEIKALHASKDYVPKRTAFGDDNHEGLDAQIKVLEDTMDEDAVYAEWGGDEEAAEQNRHTIEMALDAVRWLEGETGAPLPSGGWSAFKPSSASTR